MGERETARANSWKKFRIKYFLQVALLKTSAILLMVSTTKPTDLKIVGWVLGGITNLSAIIALLISYCYFKGFPLN